MSIRKKRANQKRKYWKKRSYLGYFPLEFFDRLKRQQLISPGFLLTVFFIVVPIGIWLGYQPISIQNPWIAVAKFNAFLAISTLSINFILSTRLKFFEKLFYGLDRMYRVHKVIGRLSFLCIIFHPLFLIFFRLSQQRSILSLILPVGGIEVSAGVIALYLFVLLLILTISIQLPYHRWHNSHKVLGIVLIFSAYHALSAGSDINNFLVLKIWVILISSLGILSWLYMLLFYKWIGPKHKVVIEKVQHLGPITELYFKKPSKFTFKPGQFVFIRFPRFEGYKELFPFSLSNDPSQNTIRVSIKQSGDYTTHNIPRLKEGDTAILMGPYGTFGDRYMRHDRDMIWIAGGIGITPFLSLVKHESIHPSGRNIHLIWVIKNESEAFRDQELVEEMKRNPRFIYVHWFSDKQGRITTKDVLDIVGGEQKLKSKLIFLCGPPGLMYSLCKGFYQMKISYHHIIFEDFNMLD